MARVKTGGRKAGTPNKITTDLREMVLGALAKAGGQKYLETQATVNPVAFLSMLGKCLPKEVKIEGEATMSVTIRRLTPGAK